MNRVDVFLCPFASLSATVAHPSAAGSDTGTVFRPTFLRPALPVVVCHPHPVLCRKCFIGTNLSAPPSYLTLTPGIHPLSFRLSVIHEIFFTKIPFTLRQGRNCLAKRAVLQSRTCRFIAQNGPFYTTISCLLQPSEYQVISQSPTFPARLRNIFTICLQLQKTA